MRVVAVGDLSHAADMGMKSALIPGIDSVAMYTSRFVSNTTVMFKRVDAHTMSAANQMFCRMGQTDCPVIA